MPSLKSMSVADLRRELERREKGGDRLQAAHAKLAKRLATIDAELADLGVEVAPRRKPGPKPGRKAGRKPGRPAGGGGDGRSRRVKNSMTLLEAILKGVAMGKTVSPAEGAAAAKVAGYRSLGQKFGQQVATCMANSKKAFKKLGRGQYQRVGGAHGGGKAPKAAKAAKAPKAKSGRKPGRPKGSKNKAKAAKPAAAAAA